MTNLIHVTGIPFRRIASPQGLPGPFGYGSILPPVPRRSREETGIFQIGGIQSMPMLGPRSIFRSPGAGGHLKEEASSL